MENFASLVPLVVLIPFGGMLLNLFLGKYFSERLIGLIASVAAGLAFGAALIMTIAMSSYGFQPVVVNVPLLPGWISIPSGALEIPWQLRVDTLSLTMMLVVTGVGTLIHIYAIGYMHGDSRFSRFFVYMNMFLAFMLILVTGNSFLVSFVGWEGVGLCSYLLIGFWFDKPRGEGWKNSNAARKAFIVNRIGDFGFLLAIFLTFWTFSTLDYYKPGEVLATGETAAVESAAGQQVAPAAEAAAPVVAQKGVFGQTEDWLKAGNHVVRFGPYTLPLTTMLTLITLFILLGVTGKSAQIPLFVWLPDAMAGPTPVSALIHAATMVTAGVFMITRTSVFFHASPLSSAVVTVVGSATALVAGFIAMGQWDIKKVLAYSTVSQLGFMVAAVGLGGYVAGMFHLVTHAFFKGLLFLGAGSVIHGVEHGHHVAAHEQHGEAEHGGEHHEEQPFDAQDMRNMGGLRRRMPITFWTYLVATFALAGVFPFAGFWSKDEILGRAFSIGSGDGRIEGYLALGLLIVAAGFTAFYMWRQINLVFLGRPRTAAAANAPESGRLMTWPLIILGLGALLGGLFNLPQAFAGLGLRTDVLGSWLEHSVPYAVTGAFNPPLAISALAVAIGAILLAQAIYGREPLTGEGRDALQRFRGMVEVFRVANAKLYWDEFYDRFVVQPYSRAADWLANTLDWAFWHDYVHNTLIGGGFNGMAAFLSSPVDRGAIDQGFLSIGRAVERLSARLRRIQTGYVRIYALVMLLGVLLVLLVILFPLIRQ
jgi:NADH-quinone oxidoreductase subunit L